MSTPGLPETLDSSVIHDDHVFPQIIRYLEGKCTYAEALEAAVSLLVHAKSNRETNPRRQGIRSYIPDLAEAAEQALTPKSLRVNGE